MRSDLKPIFEALGVPVVIGAHARDEVVTFPFIEYHRDAWNAFYADNSNYAKFDTWVLTVYGEITDMDAFYDACDRLDSILDDAGVPHYRSGDIFTGADEGTALEEFTFTIPR